MVTDLDGKFTISVESRNAVLQFSFLGYVTKEMKITPNRPMNVVLLEDRQSLDEVVVVGYQEVRKRDLTGAVSKADMKALTSTPDSRRPHRRCQRHLQRGYARFDDEHCHPW